MMFGYVPPPLGELWADVAPLLDKAVKRGENDWEEVRSLVADNRAQVWLEIEDKPIAALVTKIADGTLEVWLAGGKVLSCLPRLETIIEAAKGVGAKSAMIWGRKGWDRVLKPYGWHREGDLLVKRWNDEV